MLIFEINWNFLIKGTVRGENRDAGNWFFCTWSNFMREKRAYSDNYSNIWCGCARSWGYCRDWRVWIERHPQFLFPGRRWVREVRERGRSVTRLQEFESGNRLVFLIVIYSGCVCDLNSKVVGILDDEYKMAHESWRSTI